MSIPFGDTERLRESFAQMYMGNANAHRTLILEPGTEREVIAAKPEQLPELTSGDRTLPGLDEEVVWPPEPEPEEG